MKSEAVIRCGVAFCVGTVITELALLVVIVANDGGSFEKFNPGVLASILWGIDSIELGKLEAIRFEERSFDTVGLDEAEEQYEIEVLNLDMRDRSLQIATEDLGFYTKSLEDERNKYERRRLDFEARLDRLEGALDNRSLIKRREAISSLDPEQAKTQIMRFLQDSEDSSNPEIANDVVVMVKTMPIDIRRKILSEFQTDAEKLSLKFILQQIRVGHPEIPLIQQVREELSEFDSQDDMDST
ncbi:MAG: hypothetical protein VXZ54_04795 [Planctomycetota bacterium]|nr:hypothetical protein [Planctomycetota bacterium]